MKVYISVDIEGVTGVTHWDETEKSRSDEYKPFQAQMTREAAAACEGALKAGAADVVVKDAHHTGRNLLTDQLPVGVKVVRGWSGHPFCMVQELDESFDAAVFIGYHSRAGADTNPLSHSMSLKLDAISINGVYASEFLLHAYAAALKGVPIVFVSGDEGLCWDVSALNERIHTLAVNCGIGDSTMSMHPLTAAQNIRAGVEEALRDNLALCSIALPEQFHLELRYKQHQDAYRYAYYPGAVRTNAQTVTFETDDYFEILRMLLFVT